MSDSIGIARTMKRKNVKGLGLALSAPEPRPVAPSESAMQMTGADASNITKHTAQLEIGIEYKLDLKSDDLEVLKDLGHGNGGTVSKVRHVATGTIMAKKIIHVEAKKEMRRRIVRELQIMYDCNSEYIVNFYGAFLSDNNDVIMCMEYMDAGSLDGISKNFGPVRVDVLGKIAEATLAGLTYLYIKHHIMHRDIKPSNILVNSKGQIKLCDFGVSGELVNSVADTFVGTSTYMAPERILGQKYTVKSDVWSFGLAIMELAIGRYPFHDGERLSDGDAEPASILDLLQMIVSEPAPSLPESEAFPPILGDMIKKCLFKAPNERPTPQELYEREAFVQAAKRTPVDLKEWAVSMMEKNNRKSHLAPQLSPATRDLLNRGDDPSTIAVNTSDSLDDSLETPTPGDTPISQNDLRSNYASPTTYAEDRSTFKGTASLGRASGAPLHPGLTTRGITTNSVPKLTTLNAPDRAASVSTSAKEHTFTTTLPQRPAPPPVGSLPPVPNNQVDNDLKMGGKRQAAHSYGQGYGRNGRSQY